MLQSLSQSSSRLCLLPHEVRLQISHYLDPESFLNLCLCSKAAYKCFTSERFLQAFLRTYPLMSLANLSFPAARAKQALLNILPRLTNWMSQKKRSFSPEDLTLCSVDASNTEGTQFIYHTTGPSYGFWSTQGHQEGESEHYLLYRLDSELAIPTEVVVEFMYFSYVHQGNTLIGNPVFPSKSIVVELSMVPSQPIYTSKVHEVKHIINDRIMKIPIIPKIVVARYLKIRLIGMQSKHTLKDNLFNLCVKHVSCKGYHLVPKDSPFSALIDEAVRGFYQKNKTGDLEKQPSDPSIKMDIEEEKPEEESKTQDSQAHKEEPSKYDEQLVASGYYLQPYCQRLTEQLSSGLLEVDYAKVISKVETHQELLESQDFFDMLGKHPRLAMEYFKKRVTKQSYLTPLETELSVKLILEFKIDEDGGGANIAEREEYAELIDMFDVYSFRAKSFKRSIARSIGLELKKHNDQEEDSDDNEWSDEPSELSTMRFDRFPWILTELFTLVSSELLGGSFKLRVNGVEQPFSRMGGTDNN